jgi:CheY-like chemotaxis protein
MESSVLVVDDDADIRQALCEVFESEGLAVRSASNGRQALALVRERAPDLILLDLMMPEMNGWEVLDALRGTDAARRVVVMSAYDAPDDVVSLTKPLSITQVLDLIATVRTTLVPES